ncbi:hypothetical protein CPCC7001_818 [Cyanobium sp. PCC 7001]|nr:hypothetical protein CPCC7001_818 [Cyanobium sp. PCC 7001]
MLEHIIDNRIHDYLEAARAKDRLTLDIKADGQADAALATSLAAAACQALDGCNGYIYLKTWGLSDGTRWYKIGITNDPQRRDSEQNVLPVPAITLRLIRLPSMDHARAIEQAFQCVLADLRICNASNRELFSLSDQQLAALVNAMEGINARLDYNEALSAPH